MVTEIEALKHFSSMLNGQTNFQGMSKRLKPGNAVIVDDIIGTKREMWSFAKTADILTSTLSAELYNFFATACIQKLNYYRVLYRPKD